MRFYSFTVFSPAEIPLEEYRIVLERGSNTFNLLLGDVEEFTALLTTNGVRIIAQNSLDEFDPVPVPPLMNGEETCELSNGTARGDVDPLDHPTAPQVTLLGERQASGALFFAQPEHANPGGGSVLVDRDEPEADPGDPSGPGGSGPGP